MLHFLKFLFFLLIAAGLLLLMVANNSQVTITIPLITSFSIPLFLGFSLAFISGILLGGLSVSWWGLRWRRKARKTEKHKTLLEEQIKAIELHKHLTPKA